MAFIDGFRPADCNALDLVFLCNASDFHVDGWNHAVYQSQHSVFGGFTDLCRAYDGLAFLGVFDHLGCRGDL